MRLKVRHRPPAHKLSGPIWVRNITIVSSNVTLSLRYKYTNGFWFIFESKIVFRASIPSRSDLDPIKRRSKGIILPMLAISNKMGTKNRSKIIKIIMKNRFSIFDLETFLRHLGGVGWSPACETHVFSCLVTRRSAKGVGINGILLRGGGYSADKAPSHRVQRMNHYLRSGFEWLFVDLGVVVVV